MPSMTILPQKIRIVEVGPRDGLQNEKTFVPTEVKRDFILGLQSAGLADIEATSFVHPKWVPQLADAEQLLDRLPQPDRYWVLVPNRKGMERALSRGLKKIALFTAASESFNEKNINASVDDSFARMRELLDGVDRSAITLRIYVSTAFYCPYEGKMDPQGVVQVIERALALGADEISIGDTIGKATPRDVEILLTLLLKNHPPSKFALHFHDTYHMAIANVYEGLRMGITTFDSSAGGLGGCPYAPGASGNVATEDIVFLCAQLGIETGVNLEKLRDVAQRMKQVLTASSAQSCS